MKKLFLPAAALGMTAVIMASGCSSSGGSGTKLISGLDTAPETSADRSLIRASDSPYVGTWIDEYEYFDETYHTELVIMDDGTAAYYNDDAELGDFTAVWQDIGGAISIRRSDGTEMTAYISDGILIETDQTGAVSEYHRK